MKKRSGNQGVILTRGAMLLVWMGVIFFFSSMPGSGGSYDPPVWYILERKGAHIFEFALLSILAFRFFRILFIRASWRNIIVLSMAFVFMYGALDELHQAFVFGRGSRISDVGIDVFGSIIGLGMIWNVFSVSSLRKFKKML